MSFRYRIKSNSGIFRLLFLVGVMCWSAERKAFGQAAPRYLVLFTDKKNSPFSPDKPQEFLSERAIRRRDRQQIGIAESDLPVNPAYVAGVKATGAYVFYPTRWFNGVVVSATAGQLEQIRKLPYFKGIEKDKALAKAGYVAMRTPTGPSAARKAGATEDISYGNSRTQLEMLGVPVLHKRGFTGKGMLIAVMDGGFTRADEQNYLKPLYSRKGVLETYDFVAGNRNVYDDHYHGLQVLSVMAAKAEGMLTGAAFDADYLLYRTENDYSETPYEEAMWLVAAERADSLGADIINTSLGYNTFDDSTLDYTYAQMNGRTALISKAARFAARTGMLLVVSAGNEGNKAWRYITAPADVDSILSVGAVTASTAYASLSSVGPNAEGVLKPDVAAMGVSVAVGATSGGATVNQGTSFSAPLIAGTAALLWQMFPDKTAQELKAFIKSMGSKVNAPDSLLGYGVPYFGLPDAPAGLKAEVSGNSVRLSWEQLDGVSGYVLERALNGGVYKKVTTVTAPVYESDTVEGSGAYTYRVRGSVSGQATFPSETVTVQVVITGVEAGQREIRVHPNPVAEELYLEFGEGSERAPLTAAVLSVSGQAVIPHRPVTAPKAHINVQALPAGLYFLQVREATGRVVTRRFLKK